MSPGSDPGTPTSPEPPPPSLTPDSNLPTRGVLGWLALGLLVAMALSTRLAAPWRAEVIGDEMIHLESWRNRYRADDPMPLFRRRLEENRKLPAAIKPVLLRWYWTSPLFRRVPFLVGDQPSPVFSVLAEATEAATHSNLVALRALSVVFSLAALVVALALGRRIHDEAQGLWMAALLAIGPLNQVYAGIGRPHALSLFTQLGVLLAFVAETRNRHANPWRLLLTALAAQTTHWAGWALIGPLVFSDLIRRWLVEKVGLGTLLKQTWWYALGSVALLGVFAIESMTTSVYSANVGFPGLATLWSYVCVASPFAQLGQLGPVAYSVGGLAFLGLIGLGIAATFEPGSDLRPFRWPFLVTLVLVMAAALVMCAGTRHMVVYYPMPLVLAGLGARRLFPTPRAALAGVVTVLIVFFIPAVVRPDDPYRHILTNDPRYSEVARGLTEALGPNDVWVSFPYFMGNPLYREHTFPEPAQPLTLEELAAVLRSRPRDRGCVVLLPEHIALTLPELKDATWSQTYGPGWTLVKLPPRPR